MSFLRSHHGGATIPRYTGLQLPTASGAVPIQIVYGINKIAPNLIWVGGFGSSSTGGGGKGGGGGGSSNYDYHASFIMGLCEGPITTVGTFWNGNVLSSLQSLGLTLFTGTTPQSAWGFMTAVNPTQALNYPGTAYIGAPSYDLGQNTNVLPSLTVEVYGVLYGSGQVNAHDADPALIIQDFLTNAQYGVGFPAASIDATTLLGGSSGASYQVYCRAFGLVMSPVLSNQEAASSILARWLQLTGAAVVWSGGKLKIIPYGDSSITSYSVTFNPNVASIYDLSDDDFINTDGEDPVLIERSDPYSAYNMQKLEILQRVTTPITNAASQQTGYNAVPVTVFDQNAIDLYGLRVAPTITAHEFCDSAVAQVSAQLILQRGLYIRNRYTFKLSWEYCLLEPMDIVTLTDLTLGLNTTAVRITEIEEDDAGILTVTAEEFPAGIATAALYPIQQNVPTGANYGVSPAAVNPPLIFEPPSALVGTTPQLWAAVSGGVPTAYKLAEDSSTGAHSCAETLAAQASGATITFAIYGKSAERSAIRLQGFDGNLFYTCDFDLTAGTAGTPSSGATAGITAFANGWYACKISFVMSAAGTPTVSAILENPLGTISYAGTLGSGVYIWGVQVAIGAEALSFLSAFTTVSGASLATNSIATPEGASGIGDPNWGGAKVWISLDGNSYETIGSVPGPARQGVLTAALPVYGGTNPDTSDTLSVSLVQSGGTLASTSSAGLQQAVTLSIVDNELLAFETATLTGTNAYNLTTINRALYGSTANAHAIGAAFTRLDSAVFKYNLPSSYIGQPLYLKFQSYNIFGQGVQDLSTCVAYQYTPSGSGVMGPVAQTLATGTNVDCGLASTTASQSDDFGLASDPYPNFIDLGLASS